MKHFSSKFAILLIIFVWFCSASFASDASYLDGEGIRVQDEDHSVVYCLGRGFANIGLGWIEIPHRTIYQNSEVPFFGLFSGFIYGTFITVWRAFSGVTDVLTLGLGGGNAFFRAGLPNFPWQGPWIADAPKNKKSHSDDDLDLAF